MGTKKEISCGIIPIYEYADGRKELLIVQSYHGHFGFPKGHREEGESFLDTALRESYEEVGIVPELILEEPYFSEEYFIKRHGITKMVHYFLAFVEDREFHLQDREIQTASWVSFEEAQKIIQDESRLELLEKIKPYFL